MRQVIRPVIAQLDSELHVVSSERCPCLVPGQRGVAAPCQSIQGALVVDQEVQASWLPRNFLWYGSLDACS
jgi:hypothetical protein